MDGYGQDRRRATDFLPVETLKKGEDGGGGEDRQARGPGPPQAAGKRPKGSITRMTPKRLERSG